MLHSRQVLSSLDHEVLEIVAARDCQQGCIISPLLWALEVDSLLGYLNGVEVCAQGYADDIAIVVQGKFHSTLEKLFNYYLGLTSY